jgi:hypothetical protein
MPLYKATQHHGLLFPRKLRLLRSNIFCSTEQFRAAILGGKIKAGVYGGKDQGSEAVCLGRGCLIVGKTSMGYCHDIISSSNQILRFTTKFKESRVS